MCSAPARYPYHAGCVTKRGGGIQVLNPRRDRAGRELHGGHHDADAVEWLQPGEFYAKFFYVVDAGRRVVIRYEAALGHDHGRVLVLAVVDAGVFVLGRGVIFTVNVFS